MRPAYYGGKQRTGRPGTREKEIGFERERERERKREREREREREENEEVQSDIVGRWWCWKISDS